MINDNCNIRVLGLDCSTKTTAYCLLGIDDGYNITMLALDHYKPTHEGDLLDRLAKTRDDMQAIIRDLNPTHIAIEDIIAYMPGKSSAASIIALAQINRCIGLVARDYLGASPKLLNVMTIRHALKLDKELPPKEKMPQLIEHHLGIDFPFLWKKVKKGKGKKPKPAIKEESYDRGDAAAVALYYAFELTNKLPKKSKKDSTTK